MVKGTTSKGQHNKSQHIRCRRCGRHSYHMVKEKCSACGFPRAKIREENWRWKNPNRLGRKKMKFGKMKPKTHGMKKFVVKPRRA